MPRKAASRLVPCTILFDRADLAALRTLRERSGVPLAVFIRRAIRLSLKDNQAVAQALEVAERV